MGFFKSRVKILAESTDKNFHIVLDLLRKHVSFGVFSFEIILNYIRILEQNETKLNNLKVDTSFFKWPHQTQYQSIAAYIFYPIQVERGEIGAELIEFIEILLAASARFSNTLAQYHLIEIFQSYTGPDDNYNCVAEFKKSFPQNKETLEYAKKYTEGVPYLFGALLANHNGEHQVFLQYLRNGAEKGIHQCVLRYIVYLKDPSKMIDSLKDDKLNYLHAILNGEHDRKKRLNTYVEIGNLGDPQGYEAAAIIEERNGNHNKGLEYLEFAAEQGILECYKKMSDIYRSRGDEDNFIKFCIKSGEKGYLKSYATLGEYLWRRNRQDEAVLYLKKGGYHGQRLLREFGLEYDKDYRKQRFDDLKEVANIHEDFYSEYDYACPICDKGCSAGDRTGTKYCEICERDICIDCIAMTGCQTILGTCVNCFDFKCEYCGQEAPHELYLDENGCLCKEHRFKTDGYYIDVKFVKMKSKTDSRELQEHPYQEQTKMKGWCIKEIYQSGGEGFDGGGVICFSKSKEKLFEYIASTYLFIDSPEVLAFDKRLENEECDIPFPQYINLPKKEALETLKKGEGVTVYVHYDMCTADMTIEECPFV